MNQFTDFRNARYQRQAISGYYSSEICDLVSLVPAMRTSAVRNATLFHVRSLYTARGKVLPQLELQFRSLYTHTHTHTHTHTKYQIVCHTERK
jgi:hypothetical protein